MVCYIKNNTNDYKFHPEVYTEERDYLFGYLLKCMVQTANIHPVAIFFIPGIIPLYLLLYLFSNQPNVKENKKINASIKSNYLELLENIN